MSSIPDYIMDLQADTEEGVRRAVVIEEYGFLGARVEDAMQNGCRVVEVARGSIADRHGLRPGDYIYYPGSSGAPFRYSDFLSHSRNRPFEMALCQLPYAYFLQQEAGERERAERLARRAEEQEIRELEDYIESRKRALGPQMPSLPMLQRPARVVSISEESMSSEPKRPECVVCRDSVAVRAMVPCGHLCLCDECAGQLRQCPLCRTRSERSLRIYFQE